MPITKTIAAWFRSKNPGTVTNQYRLVDRTTAMSTLENLMELPEFWSLDQENSTASFRQFIPNEEYWEQLETMGFTDPDFICVTVDGFNISFEIR